MGHKPNMWGTSVLDQSLQPADKYSAEITEELPLNRAEKQ